MALVAVTSLIAGACGDDESGADAQPSAEAAAPETTVVATTTAETLPLPDSEWATGVAVAFGGYLDTDLDRSLAYLDAVDAAPDQEVVLFADYLRTVAQALDNALLAFDAVPQSGDVAVSARAFGDSIATRRDQLNQAADDIDNEAEDLQAALGAGDASPLDEWRASTADDATIDACFELQRTLDEAGLGVLRCVPGPMDAAVDAAGAPGPPEVALGPDAIDIAVSLAFDDESDEPSGTFDVAEGADGLGCTSGVWLDTELSDDTIQLTKQLDCTDGERSGSITAVQWFDGSDVWVVTDATGDFTGTTGTGTFSWNPDTMLESWTGSVDTPG